MCRLTSADTGTPKSAVLETPFHVSVFRVEALGVADGELEVPVFRQRHQFVRLAQRQRQGFFQKHMFAGEQALLGQGVVRGLRGRGDDDRVDVVARQ